MSKPNHFPRSLRKAGTILSAILLGASLIPSASAEDGVAVTGLVDLGLMVQHANGRTNTTMESGNNKTSTIDIRATETISDDLWVRAASYVSFMPDTGTLLRTASSLTAQRSRSEAKPSAKSLSAAWGH